MAIFNYGDGASLPAPARDRLVVAGRAGVNRQAAYHTFRSQGGKVSQYVNIIDKIVLGEFDRLLIADAPTIRGATNWGGSPVIDIGNKAFQDAIGARHVKMFEQGSFDVLFHDVLGPQLWSSAWGVIDHAYWAKAAYDITAVICAARDEVDKRIVVIANNTWPNGHPGLDGICIEHHGAWQAWIGNAVAPAKFRTGMSFAITYNSGETATYKDKTGFAWVATQGTYDRPGATVLGAHSIPYEFPSGGTPPLPPPPPPPPTDRVKAPTAFKMTVSGNRVVGIITVDPTNRIRKHTMASRRLNPWGEELNPLYGREAHPLSLTYIGNAQFRFVDTLSPGQTANYRAFTFAGDVPTTATSITDYHKLNAGFLDGDKNPVRA